VKTAEAGGPRCYDAGKKIKGRKRHIVTDPLGSILKGLVHGFGAQGRDGGYAGQKLETMVAHVNRLSIDIISAATPASSSSCPAAGSVSAPLRSSTNADASPRTGRHPLRQPRLGW